MKSQSVQPTASQKAIDHANRMIALQFATESDRYRIEGAFDAGYMTKVFEVSDLLNDLYEQVKHGDAEHQQWLKDKFNEFQSSKKTNHG